MGNEKDVFEWRQFAHWDTSAEKARLSAFLLWNLSNDPRVREAAAACGHNGDDAGLAVLEAFRRESAVALELAVKAVIAFKLRARGADPATERVPTTHDVPKLWEQAGLPALPRDDQYRLQLVRSVLMWSGRYAAPKSPKVWALENGTFDATLDPPPGLPRFLATAPIGFRWSDFDRLYQIAFRGFSQST